jgi:hypothetical protein
LPRAWADSHEFAQTLPAFADSSPNVFSRKLWQNTGKHWGLQAEFALFCPNSCGVRRELANSLPKISSSWTKVRVRVRVRVMRGLEKSSGTRVLGLVSSGLILQYCTHNQWRI